MGNLNDLFDPKSIALIGATDREGSTGNIILANLMRSRGRRIFPVNRNRETLKGLRCFKSIADIPISVSLAVIATPAKDVPGIVEECGKKGIGGVVIISVGFKEIGEEGRLLEQQIRNIRKEYGMRILGPNCMGFARPKVGLNVSMMREDPPSGQVACVSQSGALAGVIFDWAVKEHVGFSMFASLGSMIDVDFGDLMDFLRDDTDTRSVLLYMEGVGDARKFMSAAKEFVMRKPVMVLKPGRFPESAKAAWSHTGTMAGEDEIFEAAFRRTGVVRVKDIGDFFNAAKLLDSGKLPKGPRLAIVTAAGGPGVMATDALIESGGELTILSDTTLEELNKCLPSSWSKGNPIDIQGDADLGRYECAIKICLDDPGIDGILVIYVPMNTVASDDVAQVVINMAKKSGRPIIASWMGADKVRKSMEMFGNNDIPSYGTPEEAVRAYVSMYRYRRNFELLYETPAELPIQEAPPREELRKLIKRAIKKGKTVLNEKESKEFLIAYGIPAVIPSIVRTAKGAVPIAQTIGYPVTIKIVSPDIKDKNAVGGIVAGINSDEQLRKASIAMMKRVKQRVPQARIEGIAIHQTLQPIDYHLILGSKKDKDFGSVIFFGTGGPVAELTRDFSIGLPPLNQTLARRLMEETKAYKLIQGWHGKQPANLAELETTLVNFSQLIAEFPEIDEIDITHLAVSGGKHYVLDARIVLDKQYSESRYPYSHLVITPYPTRFIVPWQLSDGTEVLLRPIKPEDEPLEYELISTISTESRQTRFFSSYLHISHEWLVTLCDIDYGRHIAIVAEIKEKDQRKIVGVVRIIINPDLNSGEFALLVHDKYQGRHIGQKLLEMSIEAGRWMGLREIRGEVLWKNEVMLDLTRKLGFKPKSDTGGVVEVTLLLDSQ
jgi:acetyltransferase